jgi:hypothetical protein
MRLDVVETGSQLDVDQVVVREKRLYRGEIIERLTFEQIAVVKYWK